MEIRITRGSVRIDPLDGAAVQSRHHQAGIRGALFHIGVLVGRELKRLMNSRKTGRVYIIYGQRHVASAPGEAPANRTGKLLRSYNFKVHSAAQMTIGEWADYAKYLEDGTRRMRKRPHLKRAANNIQGSAVQLLYAMPASEIERRGVKVRKR